MLARSSAHLQPRLRGKLHTLLHSLRQSVRVLGRHQKAIAASHFFYAATICSHHGFFARHSFTYY